MSRTLRFHLDEHGSAALADGLRRYGIDVTRTAEVALRGANDLIQLEYSRSTGRVFVTHDEDYLSLSAHGLEHAGIAYCHQHKYNLGGLIRSLIVVWECLNADEMNNRVEYM